MPTILTWPLTSASASTATTWTNVSTSIFNTAASTTIYYDAWTIYSAAAAQRWKAGNGAFIVDDMARFNIVSAKTRRRLRREQREYERQMMQATAQRLEEEASATAKARALLFSVLTQEQRRSLEERRYFEINVGGKTYRIHQGTHGNVKLVQGGVETRLFCAQPNGVPVEDAMLAQKLMLEADEQAFLRVANERVLRAA